jgi:alkylation response protein AidB-like acyl-CoA dehydrogenase
MRLKDKLGDRANASSEVEYRGAWGQLIGECGAVQCWCACLVLCWLHGVRCRDRGSISAFMFSSALFFALLDALFAVSDLPLSAVCSPFVRASAGEPGKGVKTIIEMVQSTRLDCILGSAGAARRALQVALNHAVSAKAVAAVLI